MSDPAPRYCVVCSRLIQSKRADAKACSKRCRRRLSRKRPTDGGAYSEPSRHLIATGPTVELPEDLAAELASGGEGYELDLTVAKVTGQPSPAPEDGDLKYDPDAQWYYLLDDRWHTIGKTRDVSKVPPAADALERINPRTAAHRNGDPDAKPLTAAEMFHGPVKLWYVEEDGAWECIGDPADWSLHRPWQAVALLTAEEAAAGKDLPDEEEQAWKGPKPKRRKKTKPAKKASKPA
ncbi:MAG: hypothetical protein AAGG38_13540 [Planctomycetota bacterium]